MFPLSGSIVLIVTNRHYVALKILTAETTANGNEVRLLKWLNDQSRNHPGYHHIAHLLGSFQIKGPNGTHDVLVMEAMVSLSWLRREASDIISSHGKSFIYQMISGLSYLHSLQVMHGGMPTTTPLILKPICVLIDLIFCRPAPGKYCSSFA